MNRKDSLRKEVLEHRDSLPFDRRSSLSFKIINNLFHLPEVMAAKTVFFYVNFRSEVETVEGIKRALAEGKRVAVPYCVLEETRLKFVEIKDVEKDLVEDSYGILEPKPSLRRGRTLPLEAADVVLFPGSVFDVRGGRMGYGTGYYDKTFSNIKKKVPFIALAFEFQVLPPGEWVPMEGHDLGVHKIVTEKQYYECRRM